MPFYSFSCCVDETDEQNEIVYERDDRKMDNGWYVRWNSERGSGETICCGKAETQWWRFLYSQVRCEGFEFVF